MKNKSETSESPVLLQRLYGPENVLSLRDLLLSLSRSSKETLHLDSILEQPLDHMDYKNLLNNTMCIINSGAPRLQDGFTLEQTSDQIELVNRSIEALLQTGTTRSNVQCYGYRRKRPSMTAARQLRATVNTESYYYNSLTESMNDPSWELLLSRIGDALMLYILLHTSMFTRLPNDCCLQLTGTPIAQVARSWKRVASFHRDEDEETKSAASKIHIERRKNQSQAVDVYNEDTDDHHLNENDVMMTEEPFHAFHATQEIITLPHSENIDIDDGDRHQGTTPREKHIDIQQQQQQNQQQQQQNQQQQQQQQQHSPPLLQLNTKKSRPSSWQRRKAREASKHIESTNGAAPVPHVSNINKKHTTATATATTTTTATNTTTTNTATTNTATTNTAAATNVHVDGFAQKTHRYTQWPRYMPKPSEMIIPRAPIFYCGTFPPKPGFASKHVLNQLKSKEDPGRTLYASIFNPKNNPVGRLTNAYKPKHNTLFSAPIRIPKKHRHLLPLLSSMVRRAARCPFATILNMYCPLPRQLRKVNGNAEERRIHPMEGNTIDGGAAGTSIADPAATRKSLDHLMDELYQLESKNGTLVRENNASIAASVDARKVHAVLGDNNEKKRSYLQSFPSHLPSSIDASGWGNNNHNNNNNNTGGVNGSTMNMTTNMNVATNMNNDNASAMHNQKRRRHQTGLAQLVFKAGSQLLEDDLIMESSHPIALASWEDTTQVNECPPPQQQQGQQQQQQQHAATVELNTGNKGVHTVVAFCTQATILSGNTTITTNTNNNNNNTTTTALQENSNAMDILPTQPQENATPAGMYTHNETVIDNAVETNQENQNVDDDRPPHQAAIHADILTEENLASCFVPHAQVTSFIWAIIRKIVPSAMLGDKKTQRALRSTLRHFISLRRFENMSVQQAIQKMRTSKLAWMHSPQPSRTTNTGTGTNNNNNNKSMSPNQVAAQQRMLALWIGWLFSCFVVPLLRAHFFCTESEAYRQQVFYYRKPVWARLASSAMETLQEDHFAPLPPGRAQQILSARKLGVARLRLLPKRSGMRFIVNLGRKSVVIFHGPKRKFVARGQARRVQSTLSFAPVNAALHGVHQILKLEASRRPEFMGSSVFSYNDTYCRLQPFIRTWRATAGIAASTASTAASSRNNINNNTNNNINKEQAASLSLAANNIINTTPDITPTTTNTTTTPQVKTQRSGHGGTPFIVSMDVTRAFDHVDVSTLLTILENFLASDEYLVVKYTEIVPSLGDVKVIPRRRAMAADDDNASADFLARATQWARTAKGKVYVDSVVYEKIKKADAMALMRQHLTANLIRLRKQWHYQCRGIPQGSTLSTILCCLYLGHVERVCLHPLLLQQPSLLQEKNRGVKKGPGGVGGMQSRNNNNNNDDDANHTMNGRHCAPTNNTSTTGGAAVLGTSSHGHLTALVNATGHIDRIDEPRFYHHDHFRRSQTALETKAQYMMMMPPQQQQEHPTPLSNNVRSNIMSTRTGTNTLGGHAMHSSAGPGCSSMMTTTTATMPVAAPVLSSTRQQNFVLLRLIDDWLLVTCNRSMAESLAKRLLAGIPAFNIFVNPDKSKLSFPLDITELHSAMASPGSRQIAPTTETTTISPSIYTSGDGCRYIKWCGLLLNIDTLEIQGDYTRYSGEHLNSSLTVPYQKNPGTALGQKLCHYLRPKVHPLLLDPSINSARTVRLNIYQAFCLAAMKFHCYVKAMPCTPDSSCTALLHAIETGIKFMMKLCRPRKVAASLQRHIVIQCEPSVSPAHVRYLGLYAFRTILHRKQSMYKELLVSLDEALKAPCCARSAHGLLEVVEAKRSSVFDSIIY